MAGARAQSTVLLYLLSSMSAEFLRATGNRQSACRLQVSAKVAAAWQGAAVRRTWWFMDTNMAKPRRAYEGRGRVACSAMVLRRRGERYDGGSNPVASVLPTTG